MSDNSDIVPYLRAASVVLRTVHRWHLANAVDGAIAHILKATPVDDEANENVAPFEPGETIVLNEEYAKRFRCIIPGKHYLVYGDRGVGRTIRCEGDYNGTSVHHIDHTEAHTKYFRRSPHNVATETQPACGGCKWFSYNEGVDLGGFCHLNPREVAVRATHYCSHHTAKRTTTKLSLRT